MEISEDRLVTHGSVGDLGGHVGDRDDGVGAILVGYHHGVTVLALVGEHDTSSANHLSLSIREQADLGRGVVVALSETKFIDSQIVRELFRGDSYMLTCGRRLVIHDGADSTVDRMLELAGVRTQLLYADTLDDAVDLAAQHYREDA